MTAWIALVLSLMSLSLSGYLAWRDRPRIRAVAHARNHEQTGEWSSVFASISNCGRRPIVLRTLVGKYSDGSLGGIQLSDAGIRLQEGEFHELEFGKFDGIMVNGEQMAGLVDIYIEDSVGAKHKIRESAKAIQLISQSKHPFGVRTHG